MFSETDTATGRIKIDLGALVRNYRLLQDSAAPAECAATIKANAYGHGVEHIVPALVAAGCKTFFVATPQEGCQVRALASRAAIYILDGLLPGQTAYYLSERLRPVLGSREELEEWLSETDAPAALHIDTGMNRLGLSPKEVDGVLANNALRQSLFITHVMTHLACADIPDHPLNVRQIESFNALRPAFPNAQFSLGNSAATFLGWGTAFDLVRPGIALYGAQAVNRQTRPTEPVATVQARILKVRDNWTETTVGYGATRSLETVRRIATVAIGYADGLPRHLSSGDGEREAHVWCAGARVPIIGRVSMDLITIDISSLPNEAVKRGDFVEIFGNHITVDEIANHADTISYELLTQLSQRFPRHVIPTPDAT